MSGFMELQVWQEMGAEYEIDGALEIHPLSVGVNNDWQRFGERINLWWARYSAPGYLDCTDVVYGDTPEEAARECFALYGDDENPAERSELAAVLWQIRKHKREI